MVSKEKRGRTRGLGRANAGGGRSRVSLKMSKRRAKKGGKDTKMPTARKPNRGLARSTRPSSARTVAATTRQRGAKGDEEE
jgi:hypothetical protein